MQNKNERIYMHDMWIDYEEAFDSVPHEWILEPLKKYIKEKSIKNRCTHPEVQDNTFEISIE